MSEQPSKPQVPDADSPTMRIPARADTVHEREHTSLPPIVPDHELLRCIGRGSYGEVWLARNIMGVYRAVKVVYRDRFDSDRPFEREFSGIKKFEPISRSHPSQVNILHMGRQTGYFFYVMELADDANVAADVRRLTSSAADENDQSLLTSAATYTPRTLRQELQRRGRLPYEECLEIALGLTTALGHLHSHSLVHRDIKPSNIIFVNGIPKLADIGLVADAEATLSFVGTEGYLPPEGPGKAQADIYSLGKVLYEMSTGRDRLDFPELPTDLRTIEERKAYVEFNELIVKACDHDLNRRYQSVTQMHQDLVLLQAGKSLRRSRVTERRLAMLSKISAGGLALTALVVAGYFYQQSQTRVARQLARQNELQVAQLHEEKGLRLMEEGDLIGSLPWFAEALTRAEGDLDAERRHRFRIGEILHRCPRLLQIIHEPAEVMAAEFSPDGHRIVTSSLLTNRQHVSEWSFPEGQLIRRIEISRSWADANRKVLLNSDGHRLLVWTLNPYHHEAGLHAETREARLYDWRTGQPIGKPLAHDAPLMHAMFSADGLLVLTASLDRTARLWKVESGELLRTLEHQAAVLSAAFDINGDRVVSACQNGTAYLWDARTGEPLHTLDWSPPGREGDCPPVFSPDGQQVMIQSRAGVQVWNVRTGVRIATFPAQDFLKSLQVSPDGEMVLAGRTRLKIWEVASWEPVTSLPDRAINEITRGLFSPDGSRVIAGSDGGFAMIWDARSGEEVWPPLPANAPLTWLGNGVRFSPDGRMALVVSRSAHVWDMTGSASELPSLHHQGALETVKFSPDGRWVVTASEDHTARVWDAQTGRPVSPPLRHQGMVVQADFTPDGSRVLTASYDGTAQLWDARTGEKVTPPLQHGGPLWKTEITRDGKWIPTIGKYPDGTIRLWDGGNGQPVGEAIQHEGEWGLTCAGFGADGGRVISLGSNQAKAWNVPSREPLSWQPPDRTYGGFEFSPDGRKVLVSLSVGAEVLDAETFKSASLRLDHLATPAWHGAWSPDGTKVVTVGLDRTARLFDAATGKQLVPAMLHPQGVSWAVFSADGRWILTIGSSPVHGVNGDTAYLWDANTGLLATPPLKSSAPIRAAALSPDGHRLFIGSTDGTVRAWDFAAYEGSVEDLKKIVEVFSGRKVVGATIAEAIAPEALKQTYDQLRGKFPQYFASSTNDILSWHRREAEDRARSRQLFAARWHLDRVKELKGDTEDFRQWRGQVFSRGYPARDPATANHSIDLTDFYTAPLTGRRLHKAKNGHVLHNAASLLGRRMLANVEFDVRGIVHLNGTRIPLNYPKSVREIPIRRKA